MAIWFKCIRHLFSLNHQKKKPHTKFLLTRKENTMTKLYTLWLGHFLFSSFFRCLNQNDVSKHWFCLIFSNNTLFGWMNEAESVIFFSFFFLLSPTEFIESKRRHKLESILILFYALFCSPFFPRGISKRWNCTNKIGSFIHYFFVVISTIKLISPHV